MAPRIQWSVELVSDEYIVPRLEDHLIDELFYQEDEIGEMRHTAFMVECGLEEDPPDGPDVPPVPWGDMLLKLQQEEKEKNQSIEADKKLVEACGSGDNDNDSDDGIGNGRGKRELPNRSRSTDDIDTLAIELTSGQKGHKKKPPRRTNSTPLDLYVVDSKATPASTYVQFSPSSPQNTSPKPPRRISVNENRKPERRSPTKATSVAGLRSPKTQSKRIEPVRGKFTKTRSGTCHEMANAAARAREKLNSEKSDKKSAPTYRKLTKTSSGTCHEMATAATKARKKLAAEKAKKKSEGVAPPASPSVSQRRKSIESIAHKNSKAGRPAPLVRSLVATHSGTGHGLRKKSNHEEKSNTNDKTDSDENIGSPKIVYKNGKRTAVRRLSSLKSKSSDSGSEKKKEKVVYRNGKREIIRQNSSFSTDSAVSDDISDDNFLGDIVRDSDDGSVARSEISISTCGSDIDESHIPPRSIETSLKVPVRRRSVTDKSISDDVVDVIRSSSHKSVDTKKKKKKKKKKCESDDDSRDSLNDSFSSMKKLRKKKEKESLDDSRSSLTSPRQRRKSKSEESLDDSRSSLTSPRQRRKSKSEAIYGDVRSGAYPSPSSIRSKNRKRLSLKKSSPTEPQNDDVPPPPPPCTDPLAAFKKKRENKDTTSDPAIINGCYPSPSSIKANRKRLSLKKASPTESQKDNGLSPASTENQQNECTDPLAAFKKRREKAANTPSSFGSPRSFASPTSFGSPTQDRNRPDDWLGSGKPAKRTWRVKKTTNID